MVPTKKYMFIAKKYKAAPLQCILYIMEQKQIFFIVNVTPTEQLALAVADELLIEDPDTVLAQLIEEASPTDHSIRPKRSSDS